MRGGRPLSVILASAGVALAGMGVTARAQGETLSPSGRTERRVYGASNINGYLQRQKRNWGAAGSIAGHPHEHKREIDRRLRQAERNIDRQAQRFYGSDGPRCLGVLDDDTGAWYPVIGNSRRGRMVLGPALSA